MLRYYTKQTPDQAFRQIHLPATDDVWAHGEQPTDDELHTVSGLFELNPHIVRDLHDRDELPRVEYSQDQLYVFLRTVQRNKHNEAVSAPLLAVVTPKGFVTLASTNTITDHKIMKAASQEVRTRDSGTLLISTLLAVVSDYEYHVHRTGKYIRDIGRRLRTHEVDNSDFIHFVTIEDNLNEYALNLTGMLTVAERLKENTHQQFGARDCEVLDDVILYMRQLKTTVASHGQSVTSIRNAYSTIANNNLNQRMKTLTLLTVLIALPNVFFGMYGMNIALPYQHESWAYGMVVGFSIVVILIIAAISRKQRLS